MENVAGEQGLVFQQFFPNLLTVLKIDTVISLYSLMMGASYLTILIFDNVFSISDIR